MIPKRSFFTLHTLPLLVLLLLTAQLCTSMPAQNAPRALNLHQNLSLHDINQLGKDQKVKALLDVQTTIDEVQKLLTADPSLPRLTKGEIKDLFEKVTSEELQQSIRDGNLEKQEFMKSLILALPYHADELDLIENLANQKATTSPPNMQPEVPENLKKLLKSHGLLENDDSIGLAPLPILPNADHPSSLLLGNDGEKIAAIKFDTKAFEAFKPLAGGSRNVSDEVDTILKQFGLASIDGKKPLQTSADGAINSAYLTKNDKDLLDSIGITTSNDPKYEFLRQDDSSTRQKNNVKKSVGPDPVKHHLRSGAAKNEVKRQQPDEPTRVSLKLDKPLLESSLEQTDESITVTTPKPAATTTTTEESTTEESKKNTLEDEIEPIDEPEQLPGPRRSGFYMIFDWNSFLEVGEDPSKIIVRFDPKIGDPTRFLPVTVP